MYSICKSTHPATGVEHAITCYFFNRSEKCLVVAGANIIRVFRLIPDVDITKKEKYTESRPPKMKLECLSQYTLHGNVMSMQAVTLVGSQRDSLLLSFRDAKLSVVEYDQDTHDLRTVSLHYFEEEEIRDGWTNHHHIPIVRVDPEVRTFSGRIAVRQDTCAMVAISLNIQQRVHPIIWSVSNLPFDCYQAVPVKKPLGGTLIMAVNSLIYLNQSIPPYGVSLNSLAETSTNFPLSLY